MSEAPNASIKVPLSKITARQAKMWLINNDPEGKSIYEAVDKKTDLVNAIKDNLAEFGISAQSGSIIITSCIGHYQVN
jgi:hypothetical protein